MGPKVPGAIAATQGIIGTLRSWVGDPGGATAAEGEAVVLKMLEGAKVKVDGASDLLTVTVLGPERSRPPIPPTLRPNSLSNRPRSPRQCSPGAQTSSSTAQLAEAPKKLQDSENDLQNYARQAGIVIPNESQESVAADKLRQIQTDLAKAESDEAEYRAQVETSRATQTEALPQVHDDPTLRDQRARLADLRRQRSDLSVTLTPANYKIQQLDAQIAALEEQASRDPASW